MMLSLQQQIFLLLLLTHRTCHAFQQVLPTCPKAHRQSAPFLASCRAEDVLRSNDGGDGDGDDDVNANEHECTNRRRFFIQRALGMVSSIPILFSHPNDSGQALAAQTTGEAIRRSAANLPGIDFLYLPVFWG